MVSSSKTEIKDGEEITKGWEKYSKPPITYFIVICLIGLITGSVATARGTDLLGLFIVLLGFAALILLILKSKDSKLGNLILLAFLIGIGLALFHAYIMPLPDSGTDALGFETLGWQTAEAWLKGRKFLTYRVIIVLLDRLGFYTFFLVKFLCWRNLHAKMDLSMEGLWKSV